MPVRRTVWRITRAGSLSRLRQVDESLPDPSPGQARLRVEAVGLNFADILACLGLSHSHALKCAQMRLDPASKPGAELWIAPLAVVAGLAALLFLRADWIPDTALARASAAASAIGISWAVLRGARSIRRIGRTQN